MALGLSPMGPGTVLREVAVRSAFPIVLALLVVWPGNAQAQEDSLGELRIIFPETCMGSGIAQDLCKLFESRYRIPVKTLGLCTGDAIAFVKEHVGIEEYDAMVSHDFEQEEQFMRDGYAVNSRPVFYADYVIVGPPDDPAKIRGMKDALEALRRIARSKSLFCSRGDSSGTGILEKNLWKKARITPRGDWYIVTRTSTVSSLSIADRKRAYMVCSWASFSQVEETVDLVRMAEDKEALVSTFQILAMNPERFPRANYVNAMLFIGFVTSPEIQKRIGEFGIEKSKRPPFLPLAVRPAQKLEEPD